METIHCIIDSQHGIYLPQCFAEANPMLARWNLERYAEEFNVLLAGPDHPEYWESWELIRDTAFLIDSKTGDRWLLYEDCDLFMVNEFHEWEEKI